MITTKGPSYPFPNFPNFPGDKINEFKDKTPETCPCQPNIPKIPFIPYNPFGRDEIELHPYNPPGIRYGIRPNPEDIEWKNFIREQTRDIRPLYAYIRPRDGEDDYKIVPAYGIRPTDTPPKIVPMYGVRTDDFPPKMSVLYGFPSQYK